MPKMLEVFKLFEALREFEDDRRHSVSLDYHSSKEYYEVGITITGNGNGEYRDCLIVYMDWEQFDLAELLSDLDKIKEKGERLHSF